MRPVTLGSPRSEADFYTWALGAFKQIEQASSDTLTDDASSSGAALATCAGATANQFAYFTDDTHTAFADLTAFTLSLLAEPDAASVLALLGAAPSGSYLVATNNLSDVASAATSRTNLGLLSAAQHASTDFLLTSNNLSDVPTPATARANLGAAGTTQTDFISGGIKIPANQDYRIIEKIPIGATLTSFTTKLSAGTLTATLKINTTGVTGGAISTTTSQTSASLTAANVMVSGDTLVITISAVSSPTDFSFTVAYTKVLS